MKSSGGCASIMAVNLIFAAEAGEDAVFYEYENETVTVYCVFHTSRNPDKWRERLGGSP